MPPSTVDERLRGDYEVNTNGKPDALKGARPVRKGTERKGLATAPRSQSTLHPAGQICLLMKLYEMRSSFFANWLDAILASSREATPRKAGDAMSYENVPGESVRADCVRN